MDFVDLLRLKCLTDHDTAAFDQDGRHTATPEFFDQLREGEIGEHERAVFELVCEKSSVGRKIARASEDDAPRLLFAHPEVCITQGELGVIFTQGFCADDDGIGADS
jgi:hypothetical protein